MSSLAFSPVGILCLFLFIAAYACVVFEEKIGLSKSKPVIFTGCLMWLLIGAYEKFTQTPSHAQEALSHLMVDIFQLFFILLTVMTFINTLEKMNVFKALRNFLIRKKISFRKLFWMTGIVTFFLSAIADNLTSAFLMATVVYSTGKGVPRFTVPAFVSIVIAANAGGAWSPIGDITSLMVWSDGKLSAFEFFYLFIPSLISWIIPSLGMHFFIPKGFPQASEEAVIVQKGAKSVIALSIFTIALTIISQQYLHLQPFLGMIFGLGCLMLFSYFMNIQNVHIHHRKNHLDIFKKIQTIEFDTLLFFFGILCCVGALQYLGFLKLANDTLYGTFGYTITNIFIGILSAIVDNIPIMYAVLKMNPPMDMKEWLLVTYSAGTGGSLLSIGSAAGVAIMSIDKEHYTFLNHLKWSPFILLGFFAGAAAVIIMI